MIEKIKAIFKDSKKIDYYARWFVRLFIFTGVMYLVFFKEVTTITEFEEQSESVKDIWLIDYRIIEYKRNDSIIKIVRTNEIHRIDSLDNDSLKVYILRAINR